MTDRVETPKQLAKRVGVSEHQIRNLIRTGDLESVPIGGRIFIPGDAWSLFIERKRTCKCHDEIKEPSLDTLKIAEPSISPGPSTVAAASSRRAQHAARTLKTSLRNGCKSESEQSAQVIRAQALVTDVLADYITERGPKVIGQDTMARAVETLARLWEGRTVAEIPTLSTETAPWAP